MSLFLQHWSSFSWLTASLGLGSGVLAYLAYRQRHHPARYWTFAAALAGLQTVGLAVYGLLLWQWFQATPIRQTFIWSSKLPFIQQLVAAIIPLCVGWLTAILLWAVLTWYFVRRTHQVYLDLADVWLVVLGAAIVGWPAVFVYLVLIFVLSVLGMAALVVLKKRRLTDRLVVTASIIPAVLLTLAFHDALLRATYLWKISF